MNNLKLFFSLLIILTTSTAIAYADTSGDITVSLGKNYQIHYTAKDTTIQNVQAIKEEFTLAFSVKATSTVASIELTLPRELIDATTSNGEDDKFIVLVDGAFANYVEKSTSSSDRTIQIQLSPENTEIEIIGTQLGPTLVPTKNETIPASPITEPVEKPVEKKPTENQTSGTAPENQPAKPLGKPPVTENQNPTPSLQDIISGLQFDTEHLPFSLNINQLVEYSVIASIIIVIIIVITSSVKRKEKRQLRS